MVEIDILYDPCIGIVLADALSAALYHGINVIGLKEHTDERALGDTFDYPVPDAPVSYLLSEFFPDGGSKEYTFIIRFFIGSGTNDDAYTDKSPPLE